MAIKSHTIPKAYLDGFAVPRNKRIRRVWVYEKAKQPQPRSTESQGYEKGYFRVDHENGTYDEMMEAELAKFEDECHNALTSSKSPQCPLDFVYVKLASYAAMLFQRSTVRRKFSALNWSKLQKPYLELANDAEYLRDMANRAAELSDETPTPEQITDMMRKQSERFVDKAHTQSTFVKDLFTHIEICKQEMLKKAWQIWHAPEGAEFVTSDNPIVTFLRFRTEHEEIWHPGCGFGTPNVHIAFPLAPTACLVMTRSAFQGSRSNVDSETVRRVNETVIKACDRFVYSKTRSDTIVNIVNQFAGKSKPGLTAFLGRTVDKELIENHMRRQLRMPKAASSGTS